MLQPAPLRGIRLVLRQALLTTLVTFASPALACDLALILAVDVSGSVSKDEYRIQMDGLAEAIRDPVISTALIDARAAVAVVQWTGSTRQEISIPWRHVANQDDIQRLAEDVSGIERRWVNYSTAIGEVLDLGVAMFGDVPDCLRKVIDVSGDGPSNEGIDPRAARPDLGAAQITVNALVIEGEEPDLTAYFRDNVIFGPGSFAVSANGFAEYPARIRQKLEREVAQRLAKRTAAPAPGATRD